jgi:hypothetical protein
LNLPTPPHADLELRILDLFQTIVVGAFVIIFH